jgi:uncharacterized protein (DUF1697 family)
MNHTYISILRGINVGGARKLKMDELSGLYSSLGFTHIRTYIQSGNVLFRSEPASCRDLAAKIAAKIAETFSFTVPVMVLEVEELQKVVENNPFAGDPTRDESFLHVTFLSDVPAPENRASLDDVHFPGEEFALLGKWVYLFCPKGYGNTKLNNGFFEKRLKVDATTRNWKTTLELLKLSLNLGIFKE